MPNQGPFNQSASRLLSSAMMLVMLVILSACLPATKAPSLQGSGSTTPTNSNVYPDPTFPLAGIFVQEGTVQTKTQFSLPLTFTDSFLVRGDVLSQYLKTVPTTTRFCLVSKFTYSNGKDKFLILSGKSKSYTDLANKTTEFFLQVEPANDMANQNDCLTYNLTSSVFVGASSPTAYFSLNQVCSECTSSVASQGFQLYFNNGEAIPTLNMSTVTLNISGSNAGSGNVCAETSACKSRGYNCCLQGQCVNDGALRPGASSVAGYAQAILDVSSNPTRYVLYPQIYFVCNVNPGQDGQEDTNDPIDPNYDAAIRIMELKQLYQCLNRVDGEFSHCTIKFASATQKIKKGTAFSSSDLLFYDDINFKNLNPALGTGDYANNIVKIFYGNQTLYESNKVALGPNGEFATDGNDDITTAQKVLITKKLPDNALDDNLYLTFKVDGTCEKISTNLARCTKTYIQDSSAFLTSTFNYSTSKTFTLPEHMDASPSGRLTLTVGGNSVPESPTTWSRNTSPNRIIFHNSYPLTSGQTIVATYTDRTSPNYHDDSKIFKLPTYANTSNANPSDPSSGSNIVVKVAGSIVPEDVSYWTRGSSPNRIEFSASYPLYQNQAVEITYYVTSNISNLLAARTAAQNVVNTMCICGTGSKCNLNPIMDSSKAVVNYECIHPGESSTTPPANQTVFVSGKNVPHRYFDTNGVNYDENYGTALPQEGILFNYRNTDVLKPSNLNMYTGYTGFNEIYGSFIGSSPTSAKPAKLVRVKKDTTYDLYTNSGVFSTCLSCGSDSYNSMKKIFPANYTSYGGGYTPDNYDTSRIATTGTYRADDLLFGRACFVPATMIPWTQSTAGDVPTGRRNRLAGQHFLHVNGYNRDWYGFDYGSLIGSFDGVKWFSVGSQRRIKATSSKLFLAVNAFGADLAVDNNFNVTVSETTNYSGEIPDHDTETDGAECQKSHFCSNDNDCFRQVGYDYTCQNVGGISTNWPQFDSNGSEVISSGNNKTLLSLVGGNNGQAKRCVYRGRGAPCHPNLNSLGTTFNNSSLPGTLACSPNNMCQKINEGYSSRFNDRLSKYASTPLAQNAATTTPSKTDTFGLGARILGRPYNYYGESTIPASSIPSMNANAVTAICIPGKGLANAVKTYDLNSSAPDTIEGTSDKIWGIGPTMAGTFSPQYLNACPATDVAGTSIQQFDLTLGDQTTINTLTTSQNLSSNLLDLPYSVNPGIFHTTSSEGNVNSIGYQKNTCLRAPGASCFTDMDCAPSEFVASRIKATTLTGILNIAEKKYWEEGLICGNQNYKYLQPGVLNTVNYNIKDNVCCRDFGKNFTVFTQDGTTDYQWCSTLSPGVDIIRVAGVNTSISSYNRYSRVHTGYDKMTCNLGEVGSAKTFALSLKALNASDRFSQIQTQYKTLDMINQRTCCTKNWVRNFATTNGGDHKWAQNRLQTINKANFRALNWGPNNTQDSDNPTPYECNINHHTQASCEMRDFSKSDIELYSKFFGTLELVGIPQVAIMSEDFVTKFNNNEDITSPSAGEPGNGLPPDGTVMPLGAPGTLGPVVNEDFRNGDSKKLFSAANYNALQPQLKKVFSDNDFSCCIPAGAGVPSNTTAEQCCTGNLGNSGNPAVLRCCMPDYTDLTVYLSRYVSSEGRGLPDSAYDANTGLIKDPAQVEAIANQKNLCCSGTVARGVAIRKLPIPLANGVYSKDASAQTRRFTYLNNVIDNNQDVGPIGALFDAGVRWNTHVYCIPSDLNIPAEK